ncbi:MAG TPA: hypothetical protein VN306_12185 [Mycobacterium sp.]|nr:hypothetical protein [Mycobacterium sp.]
MTTHNPYSSQLTQVSSRIADIDTRLTNSMDAKKHFAIDASRGDDRAIKAIATIDSEDAQLRRERETLTAALEQLGEFEAQYADDAAAEDLQKRKAHAAQIAAACMAVNVAIDTSLDHLRQQFQRRQHLLRELAATNTSISSYAQRLMGTKFTATGAARSAGLYGFMDLAHVAPAHTEPLVTSNAGLTRWLNSNGSSKGEAA